MVRRYSSTDPVPPLDPDLPIPAYWLRPPHTLSSDAGLHRFVWDMHYPPVPGIKPEYPIAAVPWNTAPAPTSPWVMPGKYRIVLTVDGQRYTQPLTMRDGSSRQDLDADLQKQFELSQQIYDDLLALQPVVEKAASALTRLKSMREKASGPEAAKIDAAIQELESLEGAEGRRRRGPQTETLRVCTHRLWKCCPCYRRWTRRPQRKPHKRFPSCISQRHRWYNAGRSSLANNWRR